MKMDVQEDSCGIKIKEEAKECLSPTSTTHAPSVTGANNAPNAKTIISYTPASKLTPTTNNNPEPSPVNLNLKPRSKGGSQPSKERVLEEAPASATTETRATSPGSQRASTQSSSITRSSGTHEACRTGGSRSPESDSPLPQTTKLENGESIVGRLLTVNVVHEEVSPGAISNGIGPPGGSVSRVPHAKLKRLLGTLVQFASDISPETGDTVRSLVLSVLSGSMTAEEFHGALQDATNFPLRGFVLPYLKHTLPSLQRDLTNAARANNQTSVQYLRSNEAAVLEAAGFSPGEAGEVFGERNSAGSGCLFPTYNIASTGAANSSNPNNSGSSTGAGQAPVLHGGNQHSGATSIHHYPGPPPPPSSHSLKRRASDTPYYENGGGPLFDDGPLYGKRPMNPWSSHHPLHHQRQQQQQQQQQQQVDAYCWYHPLQIPGNSGGSLQGHQQSSMPPSLVQINHLAASSTISSAPHLVHQQQWAVSGNSQGVSGLPNGSCPAAATALDDEWKNIHVMLNCILGMVEKTKRALAILQRRGCPSPATPVTTVTTSGSNSQNNGPAINTSSQSECGGNDRDNSLKRISGEIVAQTIRATEDRVAEVQRRAEEAMLEAKRAAVAEVQRAIAAAAAETRAAERLRVHHRFFEPPMQRSHGGHGHGHGMAHGPLLRVVDTTTCSTTTATTTATTTTASNALTGGARDEEIKEPQPAVAGSSCWNCGRQALETCGGCGIARYCGPFCQHRDWEAGGHHATCNPRRPTPPPPPPLPPPPAPRSASRSPTASSGGTGTVVGTSGSSTTAAASTASGHTGKGK
ncbi:protein CBFA2T3 [Neodiprion virginianus]|uniref:protein CBFA2T3 n=1 Tax=Neodiprion virginianus TaxID=2961670 RepID=UPI001EE7325A|nr:protein CBFA2T3 [Neodiprion virginianus]XP_046611929.1 protein CBFA2T3 [Neodiprion virginianus]